MVHNTQRTNHALPRQYTGPSLTSTAQPITALAISNTMYVVLGPVKRATAASASIPHLGETRSCPPPQLPDARASVRFDAAAPRHGSQELFDALPRRAPAKDLDQDEERHDV